MVWPFWSKIHQKPWQKSIKVLMKWTLSIFSNFGAEDIQTEGCHAFRPTTIERVPIFLIESILIQNPKTSCCIFGQISFQIGQPPLRIVSPQRLMNRHQSFQKDCILLLKLLLGRLLSHDSSHEFRSVPRGFDRQFRSFSDQPAVFLSEGCIIRFA